jgi:3-oxoacyl-[acyl-carrier protein] reductase
MAQNGVALVTGASRGIGGAVALRLAKSGVSVAVNYLEDEAGANAVCEEIAKGGGIALPVQADVSEEEQVRNLVATTVERLGTIGILVNNAGITTNCVLASMSIEEWDRVLRVNLYGPMLCVKYCVPHMEALGGGRIVNILSIAGFQGGAQHHYVASKAGLWGLTMSLARELAPKGITVNGITPGIIDTSFHDPATRAFYKVQAAKVIPLGRMGTAQEVAEAVQFVVDNGYLTGTSLVVGGGALMA